MKHLTKLWGTFKNIPLDKNNFTITKRLFLQRLTDPEKNDPDLFLSINTHSGSIDILTEQEGKLLENIKNSPKRNCQEIPKNIMTLLKNRGYIYPSKEVEDLSFKGVIEHAKLTKSLNDKIVAFFSIDTSCAMRCHYCFERRHLSNHNQFEQSIMDKESLLAAFNSLSLLSDLRQKKVDWIGGWGGEPLQEKHLAINNEFLNIARKRNYPVMYSSNLAMLDKDMLEMLKNNADIIKYISTTLDGMPSKHNLYRKIPEAFEKTAKNIDSLLKAGIPIRVRTNLDSSNIEDIPILASYYQENGWFDLPHFKSFVSKIVNRYHDNENILTEDELLSIWLKIKDKHPIVRKMRPSKLAPTLYNIMRALELREIVDGSRNELETIIDPIISYCHTDSENEYIFTGHPSAAIYNCAECSGLSKYSVGTYMPYLRFNSTEISKWKGENNFSSIRSIDNISNCKECKAATFCGGFCALEAIVDHGYAAKSFCNESYNVISRFLANENDRLFKRCKFLLEL